MFGKKLKEELENVATEAYKKSLKEFENSLNSKEKERSVIDCIEDAKTAKFALYLIYGLLSGKRTLNQTFPFPLNEFNDDDMNGILECIIDVFKEREKGDGKE